MSDTDDYDVVQYEEVLLTDYESDDEIESPSLKCETEFNYKPNQSSTNILNKTNNRVAILNEDSTISNTNDRINVFPSPEYVRKPTRPIRLYSIPKTDLTNKIHIIDKNLVMQLLNIVKSINSQRKLKIENGAVVPNFYLMATKSDLNVNRKILEMESTDIVNLITDIIHMIKIGKYRTVDDVDIICSSPAIFLIKHVILKNWDTSMNAVYVVTSEYLLPYLCKIKAVEEEEKNAKNISNNLNSKKRRCRTKSPVSVPVSCNLKNKDSCLCKRSKTDSKREKNIKHQEIDETSKSQITNIKLDEEIIRNILSRYLEADAVKFFLAQVKDSKKKRKWSYEDKLFALHLLRDSPSDYALLYQRYSLPNDKTLEKFIQNINCESMNSREKN